MALYAHCEACGDNGLMVFDDERNIVCPQCHTANRKPTHTCPVCLHDQVATRNSVCAACRRRSSLPDKTE